jgi:hypothetical protein
LAPNRGPRTSLGEPDVVRFDAAMSQGVNALAGVKRNAFHHGAKQVTRSVGRGKIEECAARVRAPVRCGRTFKKREEANSVRTGRRCCRKRLKASEVRRFAARSKNPTKLG